MSIARQLILTLAVVLIPVSIGAMIYYDLRYFGVSTVICAHGIFYWGIVFCGSLGIALCLTPLVGHEKRKHRSR